MEDRSVWLQSHVIMLGLLELIAISLLHFFVFVTHCFHVVPMCLMTWAKVIQVKSSVLGVASTLKKSRWDRSFIREKWLACP